MAWPPPTVTSALGPLTLTLTLTLTFVLHTLATPPRPRATDVRRHHSGYSKIPPGGSSRGGSSASRDEFLLRRLSAFRRSVLKGFGRAYEPRLLQSPPPTSDSPPPPCSWQNQDDIQRMLSGLFLSENDLRTMLQSQTQEAGDSSQGQTSAVPSQKRVLVLPEGEELRGATQPQSRHGQEPAFFSKTDSTGSRVRDNYRPQSDRQHPGHCQICMTEIGYEVIDHIMDFKGHNHTVINFKNAYQFIPFGRCVNEHSPCGLPGWRCQQVTRAHWTLVWTSGTGVNLVPHEVPSHCQCLNLGHAPFPGSVQSGPTLLDHAFLSHAPQGQDQASRDHAHRGSSPLDHVHDPRVQDHAPRNEAPRDHAPLGPVPLAHASLNHSPQDHASVGPAPNHRLQESAAHRGSGRVGVRRGMGWAGLNVGHRNSTAAPLHSPRKSDCLSNTRDCPPLAASTTGLHPFTSGSSPDSYRLPGPPSPSSAEPYPPSSSSSEPYPVILDPYLSSPDPFPIRADLTQDSAGSDSIPVGSDSNLANHDMSSSVNSDPYSANPDPYFVNPDSHSSNPDPYGTKPDPSSAKPHGPSSVNSNLYPSPSSPFSVSWKQFDPVTSSLFPASRQSRPGSGMGTVWDGNPTSGNPTPRFPLASSSFRSSISTAAAAVAEDDLAIAVDATGSVTGGLGGDTSTCC